MKTAMNALGLNKSQVAEITGYSKGQTGWILEGKVSLSDKFFRIFCSELNISEHWLKTGEGEMRPAKGGAEEDHLDPELARKVMAELQGRQGKEPLQLTAEDAAIVEMIRDLPKDERKRVAHEIMRAWVACRREGK
jgi:transcriptional regulator with XRE-family HTH domain